MIRLLILVIIGAAVYYLWKWTMGRYDRMKQESQSRASETSKGGLRGKMSELVQDPVCKLYIAKDKAIQYKGHYFCSEKCRNEYNREIITGG